jgi:RNA polymerase sigma-70 factor (ECF subfamily)
MEDLKTMEQLFRQHYRAMHRLGMMLLHDEAESKDIVHDVFAELMATDRVVHPTTAETFLLTSMRNRCLNAMRNRQLHERVQRLYLLEMDCEVTTTDPSRLEEEVNALRKGIEDLHPPVCREVVVLHFHEGLKFREIAQRLGVSETTIYKHLRHALQQLRTHLKAL